MNTFKGLFRPLHAGGLLAVSAVALTLSTALPTEATPTGTRYLAGPVGAQDTTPRKVSGSAVYCPDGMLVQSGGYSLENGRTGPVLAGHPVAGPHGRKGWYASASHADVRAYVLCLPVTGGEGP
ncbi:hypothetical protein ACFWBH_00255 [Streptomyces sp. NPDC059999]|uniref:hypothetical protein n=1 Tax=Streptomyces sp. NPDC059999 TaxID=3347030 RepID=UPI0036CE09CE